MKQNSTTWFTFLAAWRVVTILTSPWRQWCYPQAPARENWIRTAVLATNAICILGRKENSPFAHFLSIFSVFFEYQIDSFLQDGNIGKLKQFTRNNASWNASLDNIIGHNGCKSSVEHETKVNELSYLFVFNSLITRSFFTQLLRFLRTVRSLRIGFWSRVCSGASGSGNLQWEILRKSVLKCFADIRLD